MSWAPVWGTAAWVEAERERLEIERAEALDAARAWRDRQPQVFAHDAERELYALASIERQAQQERARLRRTATLADLAEALSFLLGG